MPGKVADVTASEVTSVAEDAGYREIVAIPVERGVSAVPVVDAQGRVAGVVSEEGLPHKEEFKPQSGSDHYSSPLRAQIRSRLGGAGIRAGRAADKATAITSTRLMSTPAITSTPEASTLEAARSMELHGIKRLAFVDKDGHLVGVVPSRDVLCVFPRSDEDIATTVERELDFVTGMIQGITITSAVQDGVVRLAGSVHRHSTSQAVIRMINRIEGVVAIEDRIAWQTDDMLAPYVRV